MKRINYAIVTMVWLCCMALVGCQNEDIPMPTAEQNEVSVTKMLSKRTPQEAINIATEAYANMFGNENQELQSRNGNGLLVPSISVISSKRASRSLASQNDTCLYVVNFPEESGFAIIAADKSVDAVLGISDEGSYYVDADNDNPGLDQFVEQAVSYVENITPASISDSMVWVGNDDRLKVKEYDDTTIYTDISPRINHAWASGDSLPGYLENPTGAYFSNNYCGDGVVAIAHTLMYFQYPPIIPATYHKKMITKPTKQMEVNWDSICLHREYIGKKITLISGCQRDIKCHPQIADLCRAIGNLAGTTETKLGSIPYTAMSLDGFYETVTTLGLRIKIWDEMNISVSLPSRSSVLVMYGLSTDNSGTNAYFIIDGERDYKIEHHYQTSNLTTNTDTIISTRNYNLFHINWGRGGKGNGWYSRGVYTPSDTPNNTYIWNYYTLIART
jgi:hypothetical protein